MLRYSCLIIGVLFAIMLLLALVTCRLTGLPLSDEAGAAAQRQSVQIVVD